jgi:hypothetical protein
MRRGVYGRTRLLLALKSKIFHKFLKDKVADDPQRPVANLEIVRQASEIGNEPAAIRRSTSTFELQ